MRLLRVIFLLFAGVTLSACLPVTSKTPLGTTSSQSGDAALTGTWRGVTPDNKGTSYFHFLPAKDGQSITVLMVAENGDDKDWMAFGITAARLGDYAYINARPLYENGEPAKESDLVIPLLYTLKKGKLTLFLLDEKAAAEAVRSGRIAGKVEDGQFGNVELSADARSLDAFFASKDGANLFSEKIFVLTKLR